MRWWRGHLSLGFPRAGVEVCSSDPGWKCQKPWKLLYCEVDLLWISMNCWEQSVEPPVWGISMSFVDNRLFFGYFVESFTSFGIYFYTKLQLLSHPFLWSEGQSISRSQCSWSYLGCPIINFCLWWKERKKCHFVHLSRAYVLSHAQGSFRNMKFAVRLLQDKNCLGKTYISYTFFNIRIQV